HDSAICETSSTHTKIDLDIFAKIIADFHHVQFIASSDRFGSSYATGGNKLSASAKRSRNTGGLHRPYFAAASNSARSITPCFFRGSLNTIAAACSNPSPNR